MNTHPLFQHIDDEYFQRVYSAILKKKNPITVIRSYSGYDKMSLDKISLRELDGPEGMGMIEIAKDLSLHCNNQLTETEKQQVKDYFIGQCFPVK